MLYGFSLCLLKREKLLYRGSNSGSLACQASVLATALYSPVSTPSLPSMKRQAHSNKHHRVQTVKERDHEESSAPGFKDLLSSAILTYLHMSTHQRKGRLEQPDRRLHQLRSGVDGLVLAERVQLEIHHRLLRLLALRLHLRISTEI